MRHSTNDRGWPEGDWQLLSQTQREQTATLLAITPFMKYRYSFMPFMLTYR